MNESAHTPGPWKTTPNDHRDILYGPDGSPFAEAVRIGREPMRSTVPIAHVYDIANARLMSAAPELLEACKAALLGLTQLESESETLGDQLRQAIAKAEGRESQ